MPIRNGDVADPQSILELLERKGLGDHADVYVKALVLYQRALTRRRGVKPEKRRAMKARLAMLEQLAAELGADTSGWRSYPTVANGGLTFASELTSNGELRHIEPPQSSQVKGSRRSDRPPAKPAGDLLADLEASLALPRATT